MTKKNCKKARESYLSKSLLPKHISYKKDREQLLLVDNQLGKEFGHCVCVCACVCDNFKFIEHHIKKVYKGLIKEIYASELFRKKI